MGWPIAWPIFREIGKVRRRIRRGGTGSDGIHRRAGIREGSSLCRRGLTIVSFLPGTETFASGCFWMSPGK